jgi:NADPH:quinone reductase-like Zn-dependent oxidoreductase
MLSTIQHRFGGPEVVELVEVPRPRPASSEVLVRVVAAGLNPADWVTRAGEGLPFTPPFTLGWDVCGVVEEVGGEVGRFSPGDVVFGMPRFPEQARTHAAYVTAPAAQLARKPDALSAAEAGGLPLTGLTAWQILTRTAPVGPGDRVLITAAGGGVGHLAVQVAKSRGAYVIASARGSRHGFLRELGADEVVDYTAVDVAAVVRDVDVVVDAIGGAASAALVATLRPGGVIVPVRGGATEEIVAAAAARSVRASTFVVEPDGPGLEHLAALADTGRLRVHVERAFPLADAAGAHELGERGRTQGKIVLTVG